MHKLTLAIIDFTRISTQQQLIEMNLVQASEETRKRIADSYKRGLVYLDGQIGDVYGTVLQQLRRP